MYHIVIRNPVQFGLIVDYLSVGLSFRAVAKVILMTKEWTGMASIGSVSEGKVIAITQVVCSHSLELISNLLMKCWTFSLAMDMSTHMSTSYLDIWIWIFYGGTIHNSHLVALPMFTYHTGEQNLPACQEDIWHSLSWMAECHAFNYNRWWKEKIGRASCRERVLMPV